MALNVLLPTDIRIVDADMSMKIFMRVIRQQGRRMSIKWSYSEVHSPFERNFSVHLGKWRPDVERMQGSGQAFIGTHDFTSYLFIQDRDFQ